MVISTVKKTEAVIRGQKRARELGWRAIILIRLIRDILNERGNLF